MSQQEQKLILKRQGKFQRRCKIYGFSNKSIKLCVSKIKDQQKLCLSWQIKHLPFFGHDKNSKKRRGRSRSRERDNAEPPCEQHLRKSRSRSKERKSIDIAAVDSKYIKNQEEGQRLLQERLNKSQEGQRLLQDRLTAKSQQLTAKSQQLTGLRQAFRRQGEVLTEDEIIMDALMNQNSRYKLLSYQQEAQIERLTQKLDEVFVCPVCKYVFDQKEHLARFLQCGHPLCEGVINRIKKPDGTILCPLCQQITILFDYKNSMPPRAYGFGTWGEYAPRWKTREDFVANVNKVKIETPILFFNEQHTIK